MLLVLFSILVFFAVFGRYYSRIIIKKWFGWDDAMITLAFVGLGAWCHVSAL